MTQVLDEPWGRFHLDFPNDERFLSMPEKDEIRGKAYLVLLAMAGRSVIERSDGEISQAVFGDLCKRLWPETSPGLLWDALISRRVGLIHRTSRGLRLAKQLKWQRTKAEIFSAMESGRKGASKRWGSDRGAHGVPNGQPHVGDPIGNPIAEREKEKEREEEKKESRELALSSPAKPLTDGAAQLAEMLTRSLAEWGAKRVSSPVKDLAAADRLLRSDQRPLEEALAVLGWATHDSWWRPNILSLDKFRKQYDVLRGHMQRGGRREHPADARVRQLGEMALKFEAEDQ